MTRSVLGTTIATEPSFGTYIHMPVPLALAWGWLVGGWLKAFAAGAIVGNLITKQRTSG